MKHELLRLRATIIHEGAESAVTSARLVAFPFDSVGVFAAANVVNVELAAAILNKTESQLSILIDKQLQAA